MIGIYAIFRKSDDKCMYVGQSKNVNERIKYDHLHGNRFNELEYYGKVLETFDFYDKENQLNREAYWINELNPELNKIRNRTLPDDMRKYISECTQGENNPMYGKHHTEESKEKNRQSHIGMYDGEKNPMYGKNPYDYMSEEKIIETRRKNSESHKGKPTWNKGKKGCFSNETLEKMSKTRTGKKHSEQTKQNMRHHHNITKKHWKLVDGKRIWY